MTRRNWIAVAVIVVSTFISVSCGMQFRGESEGLRQGADPSPSDLVAFPIVRVIRSFIVKSEPKPGVLLGGNICEVPQGTEMAILDDTLGTVGIESKVRFAMKAPIKHPSTAVVKTGECHPPILVSVLPAKAMTVEPSDIQTAPTPGQRQENAHGRGYRYIYEGWLPSAAGLFRSDAGLYTIVRGRFLNRLPIPSGTNDTPSVSQNSGALLFPVKASTNTIRSFLEVAAAAFRAHRDGRLHAACDIYGSVGNQIFAIANGNIVASDYFYEGTYDIVVEHKDSQGKHLFTARYGEVKAQRPLQPVKGGQTIGVMGKMEGISQAMLHFELYENPYGGKPLTDRNRQPFQRRADLRDCTDFLRKLKNH